MKKFFLLFFLTASLSAQSQNVSIDSAKVYLSEAQQASLKNRPFTSYYFYTKALKIFEETNSEDYIAVCNLGLFRLIDAQKSLREYYHKDPLPYLDGYHEYATKSSSSDKLMISNYWYASYYFEDTINKNLSIDYYNKSLDYAKKIKHQRGQANILAMIGHFYSARGIYPDSARYYFNKAMPMYPPAEKIHIVQALINYSKFLESQGEYKEALKKLITAESLYLDLDDYEIKIKKVLSDRYSSIYKNLKDYEKSFIYLTESNKYRDTLDDTNQNTAILDLDQKHQKEESEKKAKRAKQNLGYSFIGFSILLMLGLLISFLIVKNSRRKRLIAVQEKELETQKNITLEQEKDLEVQKNLTLIKEQEINTINAMVEGQEKERKRVAEDLHDNLGSVIATLKLHFDNLRINREKKKIDQETLFDKTEHLIDDAYKKVRSIAHAKNAGVIANQGLLAAVNLMAEKISSANSLEIQVVHSGLDTPLDNSLEISLFRIIQELVTNVIKHAEASFVTIGLNEHQEGINIMIEDNGKGMNVSQIHLKKGMGLHSIQTRVEHMDGDFTIDSTPSKGTTIIINVPT